MKFIKKNKKKTIIITSVILVILLVLFLFLFVIPMFNNNNYGDRLDDIDKHKIASSTIKEIENDLKEQDGVEKVSYNSEGRILNFIVTVDPNLDINKAKEYSSFILDKIDKDDKSYYDIQMFIKANGESNVYPTIGYKSKNSDDMSFGNLGEQSE